MSAPGGGGRDMTAEELLAQLLTEREQFDVLAYSRAHALENDSAVFFLVALLKVYAHAYDRILRAIEEGQFTLRQIEASTDRAIQRIADALDIRIKTLETVLNKATDRMAFHTAELHAETGAIRAVKEELDKTNREAAGVFRAYKRLADDGSGTTLSQLFQKSAEEVMSRRIPIFDMDVRDLVIVTVRHALRNLHIMWGVQFLAVVLLLIVFRK